ncbi:MAG TPA: methyltransferase [Anaerolineales bacterium]|nr:methyltransferase [Anaerolineales bacterium]
MVMIKLAVFILGSVGIVYISRSSLRDVCAHGFYRFFAFEAILGLILVNVQAWFREPFSPLHIISWLLLIAALILAINGFYLLRTLGRPRKSFEATTKLVRQGAYRYIRHPLYSSLLWFAWGAFLKEISLFSTILVLIANAALIATARVEEGENLCKFGNEYAAYQRETRMFIPFVF